MYLLTPSDEAATKVVYLAITAVSKEEVERATLIWVDWFNNQRLLQPIGDISPVEYEDNYYRQAESAQAA